MPPEERLSISDLLGELAVSSGAVLPKGEMWQSSRLLLDIEAFDDRDEFVPPIAVPAR